MELHQLRYFVRVAGTLSFTRAAAELAVAQPSLSQQIQKLERELGFSLFERDPAVSLTGEGRLFLPYAQAVLTRVDEARTVAQEIRGVRRGEVTLGISPIAGARLLPVLMRAVRERYPGVTLRTREEGLRELLDLLRAGEIDLAMVLLPTDDPNLVCVTLLSEDLVLVMPEGHSLARHDEIAVGDLCDEPFVLMSSGYGLRQRVLEECAKGGFKPSVAFESGDVGIIQGLVEAGLGITILPESAIRGDLAIATRPIHSDGVSPQRQVGLAYRGDRYVPLAARHVFALAEEVFGQKLSARRI